MSARRDLIVRLPVGGAARAKGAFVADKSIAAGVTVPLTGADAEGAEPASDPVTAYDKVETLQGVVGFDQYGDIETRTVSVLQAHDDPEYPPDDAFRQDTHLGVAPPIL